MCVRNVHLFTCIYTYLYEVRIFTLTVKQIGLHAISELYLGLMQKDAITPGMLFCLTFETKEIKVFIA